MNCKERKMKLCKAIFSLSKRFNSTKQFLNTETTKRAFHQHSSSGACRSIYSSIYSEDQFIAKFFLVPNKPEKSNQIALFLHKISKSQTHLCIAVLHGYALKSVSKAHKRHILIFWVSSSISNCHFYAYVPIINKLAGIGPRAHPTREALGPHVSHIQIA